MRLNNKDTNFSKYIEKELSLILNNDNTLYLFPEDKNDEHYKIENRSLSISGRVIVDSTDHIYMRINGEGIKNLDGVDMIVNKLTEQKKAETSTPLYHPEDFERNLRLFTAEGYKSEIKNPMSSIERFDKEKTYYAYIPKNKILSIQ